jgi:uncharacterized cysteine cluster protein YcgN (CxxCxxCC family)
VRFLHWMPEECAYVVYVRHKDTLATVRAIEKKKKTSRKDKRRR